MGWKGLEDSDNFQSMSFEVGESNPAVLISMSKKVDTKLVKRTVVDWLKVLVLLLDEAAVLALVIVVLWFLGIRIPLPIMIPMVLLLGIFVFMIHKAIIPSFHLKQVTGREGMIGIQGRVAEPLAPVGAVIVKGERWRARSVDDNIEVDENVEIVGVRGLTLEVKRQAEPL